MPWVRVDDHFNEHPKLAKVGPLGWGIWLAGLAYCNRNLTDGFIPLSIAEGFGGSFSTLDSPDKNGRQQIWTLARGSGFNGEDMTSSWVI